jgi:hypothetical protein
LRVAVRPDGVRGAVHSRLDLKRMAALVNRGNGSEDFRVLIAFSSPGTGQRQLHHADSRRDRQIALLDGRIDIEVHLQHHGRISGQRNREWLRWRLHGGRGLIQLWIEFTHLLVHALLASQRERASRLVLDCHLGAGKRDHQAVVGTRGNTLAGQKCRLRLQMFQFNILGSLSIDTDCMLESLG